MNRLKALALRILSKTRIVDDEYYKNKYRDVARSGLDTSYHYFHYGFSEGRHPNLGMEKFSIWYFEKTTSFLVKFFLDEKFYLKYYPDVAGKGLSAAEHYASIGRKESRRINQASATLATWIFFLKLKIRDFKKIPPTEAVLESYRRMLFEEAQKGIFTNFVANEISRQLNLHKNQVLLGKYKTISYTELPDAGHEIQILEPSYPMTFREPEVVGSTAERPPRTVEVPEQWIASIKDAKVVGGFQVLSGDRFVIYEPAANPHEGFVAGIWQYVVSLNHKSDIFLWFRHEKTITLPAAILLGGRCSPNYYHWLIEYLGKAYLLSGQPQLQKIPLLVADGMFEQEFESLQALLPDWPIYRLDNSTLLNVGNLYVPSSSTNLADNLREPMWKTSAVCFKTLKHMQTTVFSKFGIDPSARGVRKVFLARRSGRNIANAPEIEALVASFGYEVVDTGTLSFEQQVRLFSEARTIIGAMGAAFTNLIFCKPETEVLALASPYAQLFCSQSNMALFAGCHYRVLAGSHPLFRPGDELTIADPGLFQDSYTIDPDRLAIELDEIERRTAA